VPSGFTFGQATSTTSTPSKDSFVFAKPADKVKLISSTGPSQSTLSVSSSGPKPFSITTPFTGPTTSITQPRSASTPRQTRCSALKAEMIQLNNTFKNHIISLIEKDSWIDLTEVNDKYAEYRQGILEEFHDLFKQYDTQSSLSKSSSSSVSNSMMTSSSSFSSSNTASFSTKLNTQPSSFVSSSAMDKISNGN